MSYQRTGDSAQEEGRRDDTTQTAVEARHGMLRWQMMHFLSGNSVICVLNTGCMCMHTCVCVCVYASVCLFIHTVPPQHTVVYTPFDVINHSHNIIQWVSPSLEQSCQALLSPMPKVAMKLQVQQSTISYFLQADQSGYGHMTLIWGFNTKYLSLGYDRTKHFCLQSRWRCQKYTKHDKHLQSVGMSWNSYFRWTSEK